MNSVIYEFYILWGGVLAISRGQLNRDCLVSRSIYYSALQPVVPPVNNNELSLRELSLFALKQIQVEM